MDDEKNKQEPQKKESCLKSFLVFIGVLAIGAVLIFILIKACGGLNEDNKDGGLLTRAARTSDISFDDGTDISITLSAVLYFTPSVDIDDLQITLNFRDSNRNILSTQVKDVGDVQEGGRYSISYSLSDLGLSVILNCKTVSWTVTGGTVSYFA